MSVYGQVQVLIDRAVIAVFEGRENNARGLATR
jgi:hypothetical protein